MTTLALDIGGANLKAAHSDGRCVARSFALWKHPEALAEQLRAMASDWPVCQRVAITMTAELCDCFATKRQGVEHVLDAVWQAFPHSGIGVWSTEGRFVHPDEARQRVLRVAAANWHALATWLAPQFPVGLSLLIDTGSTTTDILRLDMGQLHAAGWTDTQRLVSGELVYVGVRRTPLMALGPTIEFHGYEYGLMSEYFASTADVFLLTGQLEENAEDRDTADGRPFTRPFAMARLLRMIGADIDMISPDDAMLLAQAMAARARDRVTSGLTRVLGDERPRRIILSGSGAFLAQAAVEEALPKADVIKLSDRIGAAASQAACAHALLHLADESAASRP
ncbi:MAG: hydantoinase/oxoprolinase family protein [Phycisphaeraceae bacterium]